MKEMICETICVVALCSSFPALAKVAGPVPLGASPFADAEASTNVPPPVRGGDPLAFGFSLEFAGSESNGVEIAFGRDADGDGVLAPEETDLAVGWDCGEWFVRSEPAGTTEAEPAAVSGGRQALHVAMRVRRDGRVSSFEALAGASPVFAGLAAAPSAWLHDRAWDLCRLTARGADAPGASFLVSSVPDGLKVIVR